jgi:PAS domain S-box-containing protein
MGLAPGWRCEEIFAWPPDGFAFSAAVLSESGAYRLIVSPPRGRRWPPRGLGGESWETAVQRWAVEWAAWAIARRSGLRRPEALSRLTSTVRASRHLPLAQLDEPQNWETLVALLTLHAMADEACTGLGVDRSAKDPFHASARKLLREKGTMSRFAGTRARVLPKSSLPRTGITIRSLSRYLGLDRSETEVRWYHSDAVPTARSQFTLLLVPYPARISQADFRAIRGPLDNMDPDLFGFFEFAPRRSLDIDAVLHVVDAGQTKAGSVDAVVLPESVLQPEEADHLRRALHAVGVAHLVAGVREPAVTPHGFGQNYAYVSGSRDGASWAEVQHKHHRWSLDEPQIRQYHLERRFHPGRRWWEAIGVERRSLMFVTVDQFLTLCPLICEDLAQPDPVATIIREVGPSLVIGLLLDGPQLAERWPARYASVLADDPGCAVLTLTSLGMAQRSLPPGFSPSRSVALWKDAHSGIQELSLDEGAAALAVTAAVHHRFAMTADGRSVPTAQLLLEDVQQVPSPHKAVGPRRKTSAPARAQVAETGIRGASRGTGATPAVASPDVRSDDAVYVCDREARIVSWNRALEKLTGIPAGQAIGRRCFEVIGGTDDAGRRVCREHCVVSQRAKRGRPRSCPPLLLATKHGSKALNISTLIVREGTEPLVIHIARERRS